MLTTRFNLCQGSHYGGRRQVAELAAGAKHISPAAFSDEHVNAGLSHDRLESEDVTIRGTLERAAGEWVKRDQVDLTGDAMDKFDEPAGIF